MRRLVLALALTLTGCDLVAGRALGPEDRCPKAYIDVRGVNAAGDSVTLATYGYCAQVERAGSPP